MEVLQPSLNGSCFADEAHQGALIGHEVSLQDGHVTSVLPVHGHTLEPQSFQDAVATLGRVATTVAFLPGLAAIGYLAGQPGGAIGVGAADGDCVTMLVFGFQVRTLGHRILRVMLTSLGAAPLGSSSPVIVAIGMQDITERAKGVSILVVPPRQSGLRIIVGLVCADVDHA